MSVCDGCGVKFGNSERCDTCDVRKPSAASAGYGSLSVRDYSLESMVERAVRNARPHKCGGAPRWVAVMDTFAIGSTFAYELCRNHGLDPDDEVSGPRCLACEP